MPMDFEIRGFLEKNHAEVRGMLDTEYDEAKIRELFMADGRREGRAEEQANTERERKRAEAAEEQLKQLEKEIELLKKQLSNK